MINAALPAITSSVHASGYEWHGLAALAVILALTVLPVSLAARFAGARRPGFLWSAVAVVLGGIVLQFVFAAVGATLTSLAIAFLAMCAIYALVLQTSLLGGIGIAVMAFFFEVLIAVGLYSLGLHLNGMSH